MPKPTYKPPQTAEECRNHLQAILADIQVSCYPDLALKLVLDLFIVVDTAVKNLHAALTAEGCIDDAKGYEQDLHRLVDIQGALMMIPRNKEGS